MRVLYTLQESENTHRDKPLELRACPDVHLFVLFDTLDEHVVLGHGALADVDHAAFGLGKSAGALCGHHRELYLAAQLRPAQAAFESN